MAPDSVSDPVPGTRPSTRKTLRLAVVCGLAVAVGVALYVVYWFTMAMQLRSGIAEWAAARRTEGVAVTFQGPELSGFPFRVRARLENPAMRADAAPAPWRWQGTRAYVELRPWNFSRLTMRLPGRHEFRMTDAGRETAIDATAKAFAADIAFAAGRAVAADVTGEGIVATGNRAVAGARIERLSGTVKTPVLATADHRTPTVEFDLTVERARLPDSVEAALGRDVARLAVAGQVLGAVRPGPAKAALAAWRDAGGTVRIDRAATEYGPLTVKGDGTLALDKAMQPIGAFAAHIEGLFETIDRLRDKGLIRSRDSVTAKVVLGAFMRKDGGRHALNIAVTVQDRTVFVGPVALMSLPPVEW